MQATQLQRARVALFLAPPQAVRLQLLPQCMAHCLLDLLPRHRQRHRERAAQAFLDKPTCRAGKAKRQPLPLPMPLMFRQRQLKVLLDWLPGSLARMHRLVMVGQLQPLPAQAGALLLLLLTMALSAAALAPQLQVSYHSAAAQSYTQSTLPISCTALPATHYVHSLRSCAPSWNLRSSPDCKVADSDPRT